MTEQFQSRREARDAERSGVAITPSETAPAAPKVDNSQALASMGFPPLTANQISQISSAPVAPQTSVAQTPAPVTPVAPAVTSNFAPINYAPINYAPAVTPPSVAVISQSPAYDSILAEAEEPITQQVQLFDVSPNLSLEPQTKSIIIDTIDPLDNVAIAISETGEMLKTGSIEIPMLGTHTGEIATIEAYQVDEAIAADSVAGYVSTIAPIRASGVVNTAGKIGIMPSKTAKGQGQVYIVLSISLLMITLGGLTLAAYMLGFFK